MLRVRYQKNQTGGAHIVSIEDVEAQTDDPTPVDFISALFDMPFNGWELSADDLCKIYIEAIGTAVLERNLRIIRLAEGEVRRLRDFAVWADGAMHKRFYEGSPLGEYAAKARDLAAMLEDCFLGDAEEVAREHEMFEEEQRQARLSARRRTMWKWIAIAAAILAIIGFVSYIFFM